MVHSEIDEIVADDPRRADVVGLLQRHLSFAQANSPACEVFALDADDLADPSVAFFTYRSGGELLGMGALRFLEPDHAELKSMHVVAEARGRGVGRALVDFLVATARAGGARRVSLETGTGEAFVPARSLYAASGFEPCAPFGEYVGSTTSVCMTRELS